MKEFQIYCLQSLFSLKWYDLVCNMDLKLTVDTASVEKLSAY